LKHQLHRRYSRGRALFIINFDSAYLILRIHLTMPNLAPFSRFVFEMVVLSSWFRIILLITIGICLVGYLAPVRIHYTLAFFWGLSLRSSHAANSLVAAPTDLILRFLIFINRYSPSEGSVSGVPVFITLSLLSFQFTVLLFIRFVFTVLLLQRKLMSPAICSGEEVGGSRSTPHTHF
jgi:hypothetical protein